MPQLFLIQITEHRMAGLLFDGT